MPDSVLLLLLVLGAAAIVWGLVSIARRRSAIREANRTHAAVPQPPRAAPSAASVKDVVTIAGGIVAILVGILNILEKLHLLS